MLHDRSTCGTSTIIRFWNFKMARKSDNKKIAMPILFVDTFNDDGMIVDEMAYYSDKLLEK